MNEANRDKLQELFRDVFGDDAIELRDDLTADEIDAWDSLAHVNLIIALEKRFQVRFAAAEMSKLKDQGQTVRDLITMLDRKLDSAQ